MGHEDTIELSVGESPFAPQGAVNESAAVSDRGRRAENQDSYLVEHELGLYVVADGVGGHQGGNVASATATRTVRDIIAHWRNGGTPRDTAWAVLHRAIESACATIHRSAQQEPSLAGMSTTLTVLLIDGNEAVMGHVGDSRLYLLRSGTLHQISTDHTLAAELYRGGVVAREHVDDHPHAHVLTRNVGSQPSVEIETLLLEVHPGDLFLLCSDGLNPAMHPPEHVVDVLDSTSDLCAALGQLVERAKAADSRDNITAVAWRREGGSGELTRPVVEVLRAVPLLAHLSLADLARVAAEMAPRSYAAGETVLQRGDRNGGLHVVLEGRLRWTLPSGHYAFLESGAGVGTTTLVNPRPSPADVVAEEDTRVLVLGCEAFRNLCTLRQRLGVHLLLRLADELSDWIDPETDRGKARPPHGLLVEY